MKIQLHLEWQSQIKKKALKHAALNELLIEYKERLEKFIPCEILGAAPQSVNAGELVWCCDISDKALSSEKVAEKLSLLMDQGVKTLKVVIGGPDGMKTYGGPKHFVWSFGPLTLTHEMASVIALEQLYRAMTIIKKHPYHSGH